MTFGAGFGFPKARFPMGAGPTLDMDFAGTGTLPPSVTFSRASNATYVDSAGNLAYAPSNLLTFSEQFDSAAWVKVASTVQANSIVAPDGTTTADTITFAAAGGDQRATQGGVVLSGAVCTFSVWLKGVAGQTVNIEIETTALTVTLTAAWVRYSVSGPSAATIAVCRVISRSGNTATVFNLWGAQLNLDGLQPYNSTTVKNLLGYTQEFENAAWTKSNSFIQTNLLTYSEQFDNAAWGKVGMTVTANAETAPNNTVTGDKLIPDVVTGLPYAQQTITVVSGANYAWSVYLKAAGYSWVFLDAFDGANHRTWFDLSTGTIGTVEAGNTATITDVGNGWYRCTIARSSGGASTSYAVAIVSGNNDLNITGNGVSGVFAWGAQLVQGTTPGDYQATTTTTLPVQYRAPDGSLTADKLVETTATGQHRIFLGTSPTTNPAATHTVSFYAKAAELTTVYVGMVEGNTFGRGGNAIFNLSTGTVISAGSGSGGATGGSASIVSVGGGWFRCAYTLTLGGSDTRIFTDINLRSSGTINYTGDGTSGIYIWGAQLSDSASLDPYVYNFAAAPAAAAYYGPRFDHNPSTLAPLGLLIEEQRTNLFIQNTNFDSISWTKLRSSITADATVSPDGTLTGDKLIASTDVNTSHFVRQDSSVTSGATYTQTLYAKAAEYTQIYMGFDGDNATFAGGSVIFTLAGSGTAGVPVGSLTSFSITPVRNGWYRCQISATAIATATAVFRIQNATGGTNNFTGDGISGVYIWGAQLELGAFATSVIPTTTAAATRATDTAVMQGANFSNWYNPVEGTLFVEAANAQAAPALFSTDDGTTSNRVITYFNAANSPAFRVVSGGVDQANFAAGSIAQNATFRLAAAYQLNNFAASLNGAATVTDTSGTVPTVQTTARLGANVSGATIINGYLARIAYYPRRLSNNELQAITT